MAKAASVCWWHLLLLPCIVRSFTPAIGYGLESRRIDVKINGLHNIKRVQLDRTTRTRGQRNIGNLGWHLRSDYTSRLQARTGTISENGAQYDEVSDVLILGSGPAARSIGTILSSNNIDVILADSNFDREWAPNYGVWRDEWDAVCNAVESASETTPGSQKREVGGGKVGKSVDREWLKTDCFFGGSFGKPMEERLTLDRPYCRIDKRALSDSLTPPQPETTTSGWYKVLKANHISSATSVNLFAPAGSLVHDETGSTIVLQRKDGSEITVRSKLIIDCTGHETQLVLKDRRVPSTPPGFQIAWGATLTLDESDIPDNKFAGPYDKEAMTLFDYRTDHFEDDSDDLREASKAPTFIYVMPLEGNKVFFEETSLVARPAISFQVCKDRCYKRLKHLGIKSVDVDEEEFCYIPMGGPLPERGQRIVGFGGAAAMVHPSTGYHLCRMMMASTFVSKAVLAELSKPDFNPDRAAAAAYDAAWPPSNIAQRNFAVFGGEFLMKQSVEGLRGFFNGFFRLPLEMWAGFLAGWPGLPNNDRHETWFARLWFGLTFISSLPLPVALDMASSILVYSLTAPNGISLPQCVTPLLGEPDDYEYKEVPSEKDVGDVAAKAEARKMIMESQTTDTVPVAFDPATDDITSNGDVNGAVTSTSEVEALQ